MAYTYEQRKRPQGPQRPAPEPAAAPGPGFCARQALLSQPKDAGAGLDLDGAMRAKVARSFGDLSAVKEYGHAPRERTGPDRGEVRTAAGGQAYTGPVTHALSSASPSPAAAGPVQAKWSGEISREAADKAAKGDYSEYYKTNSEDKKGLTAEKKELIQNSLNSGADHQRLARIYGRTTSDMLNPVTRQAMNEIAQTKGGPAR